ncbi:hypothetical protein BGZ89_010045, partial [Linnemannia elongata]
VHISHSSQTEFNLSKLEKVASDSNHYRAVALILPLQHHRITLIHFSLSSLPTSCSPKCSGLEDRLRGVQILESDPKIFQVFARSLVFLDDTHIHLVRQQA